MYVPEKLKLNKFKVVAIPKKGDYFKRYGENNVPLPTTGDEIAPHAERKTDSMAASMEDLKAWDEMKAKEEKEK